MRFMRRCDGVCRRDLLHVGGLTAFGLGLSDLLRATSSAADSPIAPKAKSCILIWLDGGPSHLDTFDLKPDAPAEIRGPFSPIQTNVAGVHVCEQFSRTSQMMDKLAVIRSLTSPLGEHNFASHYLLTGYKPSRALTYPSIPSVQKHLSDEIASTPTNVALARPNGMLGAGYLPDSTLPFVVDGDPSKAEFRVRDLELGSGLNSARLHRRRNFRQAIDEMARVTQERLSQSASSDSAFDQAFRLVQSKQARAAFDLGKEPQSVRNRYGRHRVGQSCLMARRLIEAGARFVTVTDRGWDTHQEIYLALKEGFTGGTAGKIPKLDQAFSALITDLVDRSLLDSTLVLLMGEFGRTPKLNPRNGRDHWPGAFSVVMAGGGVHGGQTIGQSDATGELPADRPVSPADVACSVFTLLGLDPTTELQTADGRPIRLNRDGSVIKELFG